MYKNEILDNIMKYQFYAIELNLYLDNFPNNQSATKCLEEISQKLNYFVRKYEKSFGPFTNFGSASVVDPEAWVKGPWPWKKCNWEE